MDSTRTTDSAAAVRKARFGTLPDRVRHEDTVEERPGTPRSRAGDAYSAEGSWLFSSCLALDLGL